MTTKNGQYKCSKCEKDMLSPRGEMVFGVNISIPEPGEEEVDLWEYLQKQMGKYPLGVEHILCLECYLDLAYGNRNPYL